MRQHAGWLVAGILCAFMFAGAAISGPSTPSDYPGAVYNSTPPTLSDGQAAPLQAASDGSLKTTATATISGTVTVQGGVTPADAKALGTTAIGAFTYTGVYNGTTEDLWRGAANGLNSTGTGLATAQIIGQCDDTSPTALTENSFGNVRIGCTDHSQLIGVSNAGVVTAINQVATGLNSTGAGIPAAGAVVQCLASPGVVTDAQFGLLGMDCTNHGTKAVLYGPGSNSAVAASAMADGISNGANALYTNPRALGFNGSSWDRVPLCSSQVSATITAGNTTQIVALSGSTAIRVCSAQVGISASGTYKFVYGTGSNCGTGTTDITPAANLTSGNVVTWGNGYGVVFRGAASNALCVTAATGNVQVFVSYAQY